MSGESSEGKRKRAQSHFEKAEQRKIKEALALEDYRSKNAAVAAKTARLRALRLAKEAADSRIATEEMERKIQERAVISVAPDRPHPQKPRRKSATSE